MPVSRTVDLKPLLTRFLTPANLATDGRRKNLGTPSGQAAEPGTLKLAEGCVKRPFTDPGKVKNLYRGKRLYRGMRRRRTDCAQDFQVNVELPGGVQAADHVNFRGAVCMRRRRAIRYFINGELVRCRIASPFTERAKGAFQDANIGLIDVPIDDVIRAVTVPPVPFPGCHLERASKSSDSNRSNASRSLRRWGGAVTARRRSCGTKMEFATSDSIM